MVRRLARLVLVPLSFFSVILLHPFPSRAVDTPSPALEALLKQVENRNFRWIAIRADVILFFVAPGTTRQAMCGGELVYQRLDERMLLSCHDQEKNPVFIFRTMDRRFDLYVPSQNTLYHGSVFDLEDSPEVESHLKPLDLFRALKPGMFDPKRTEVDNSSGISVSLNVFAENDRQRFLSRKAYLTPAGDVVGELFFDPEGQTMTEIQRYDFREISSDGGFGPIIFPKKVTIVSPQTGKNTAIFLNNVKALDSATSYQFLLRIPKGTNEVFLREIDPKFTRMAIEAEKIGTSSPGGETTTEENGPVAEMPATAVLSREGIPASEVAEKTEADDVISEEKAAEEAPQEADLAIQED
jgi:hypothetical protein